MAATEADPSLKLARPAQPAYVGRPQTLFQRLCRLFVHDQETDRELHTLAGAAIGLMAAVLRPLGSVLTTLPLGPDHPGELAGPAFFMSTRPSSCRPGAKPPGRC